MSIGDTIVIKNASISSVSATNKTMKVSLVFDADTFDSRQIGEMSKLTKKTIYCDVQIDVQPPKTDPRPGVGDPAQTNLGDDEDKEDITSRVSNPGETPKDDF